jgi:hypothetical protein
LRDVHDRIDIRGKLHDQAKLNRAAFETFR